MRKVIDVVEELKLQGEIDIDEDFKQLGFDYCIAVGHRGTVVSLKSKKKLSPQIHKNGYVIIHFGGKGYLLHRLVAQCHIPNLYNKAEVNHIDCDKKNNCVDNLAWVNKRENCDHAKRMGRYNKVPSGKMWRIINGKRVVFDEPADS